MQTLEADKFIRKIRNPRKKEYARLYLSFLLAGQPEGEEPKYDLTYMGAQSVRMSLSAIIGKL